MEIKSRFDHFNINVTDLERSIAFYGKALGLKEHHRKEASEGSFILVYLTDNETGFLLELTCIITSTIDTIMRLMSICEAYEIMLVSCPVVIAPSAPCPFIIRLAPNHDIKSIEPYTASCMSGPLKASILSARVNSR